VGLKRPAGGPDSLSDGMMSDSADLLDISQAAQFLNVSKTSLRRWTNAGLLPCLRVGGRRERRFRRSDLLAFIEQQAGGDEAKAGRPMTGGAQSVGGIPMPLGTHLCGLYATDDGRTHQAATFLVDGVGPGGTCFLVAGPEVQRAILTRLEESRPSLRREIAAGRLVLSEYGESAEAQWRYWERSMSAALRDGAETLRVVGDLHGLRARASAAETIEYEAGYEERIARRFPVVTLCQYDARQFSPIEMLDALKGHRDTFRYPAERVLA
jgi:excisionase family DNA binding protein